MKRKTECDSSTQDDTHGKMPCKRKGKHLIHRWWDGKGNGKSWR